MGRRTLLLIASILVAALGTALIWLYVQGADNRAAAGSSQVEVYVASQDYPPGTLAKSIVPVRRAYPQAVVDSLGPNLITDPQRLDGYAQTNIVAGLPLLANEFGVQPSAPTPAVQLAPDKLALQVTLPDPQRLAGLLQPGSLIRIFGSVDQGKTAKCATVTKVLLDQVKVLASGPVSQPSTAVKADVPQAIVTLELSNQQALDIVATQTEGSGGKNLWFGLLGSKTPDPTGVVCTARTDS